MIRKLYSGKFLNKKLFYKIYTKPYSNKNFYTFHLNTSKKEFNITAYCWWFDINIGVS